MEDWVAEEPEAHLLPHIERACADSGLELLGHELDGAVFVVRIGWTEAAAPPRRDRRPSGSSARSPRPRPASVSATDSLTYEVVTGMLDGDSPFAPHGHMVRIELVPQG